MLNLRKQAFEYHICECLQISHNYNTTNVAEKVTIHFPYNSSSRRIL